MLAATQFAELHADRLVEQAASSGRRGSARRLIASMGVDAVREAIDRYRAGGEFSSDADPAWLSVVLRDLRVRDDAWARMDPEFTDAHLRLWTDLTRRARPGFVAPAASLLAFVAWQSGNGALANVALDRAQADTAGYTMARLLREVVDSGVPPRMARLPMTPEEVAASYEGTDEDWEQDYGDADFGDPGDSDCDAGDSDSDSDADDPGQDDPGQDDDPRAGSIPPGRGGPGAGGGLTAARDEERQGAGAASA
jgi:hypothetical protein